MTLREHRSNFGIARIQIEYNWEMRHSDITDQILALQEHKLRMIGKCNTPRTQIKFWHCKNTNKVLLENATLQDHRTNFGIARTQIEYDQEI